MQNEEAGVAIRTWLSSFSDEETGAMLLLIETGAFTCSVLREWGFRIHFPIGIIGESLETADEFTNKLAVFQKRILNTNMSPSELLEAFKNYHDDLLVFQFAMGRYTTDNFEMIKNVCMRGESQENKFSALVLILFEQLIPEMYQDFFSIVINIEENGLHVLNRITVECIRESLKQRILTCSQVLEYKITNLRGENVASSGRDYVFWNAVKSMIEFTFTDHDTEQSQKLSRCLCEAIERAYDLADSYEVNSQIPDLFRAEFDKAIPSICKFFPEKEVSALSALESEYVFFDAEFYYIPNTVFTRICEPLRSICTVNQVKEALAKANILCIQGQARVYNTVKKKIGNTTVRVVCLKRETLEENSQEMSFLDMFRIRGRKI